MSAKGYLVPVELKFINEAIGQGVFSVEFIPKGQPLWMPNMVTKLTPEELSQILLDMNSAEAHEYLRQGFVLASDLNHFCVNRDDLGRFTNHSSNPNLGYAEFQSPDEPSIALRDIQPGEEITCDYSGLGSPPWYKELCAKYHVIPTDEVVKLG